MSCAVCVGTVAVSVGLMCPPCSLGSVSFLSCPKPIPGNCLFRAMVKQLIRCCCAVPGGACCCGVSVCPSGLVCSVCPLGFVCAPTCVIASIVAIPAVSCCIPIKVAVKSAVSGVV